MRERFLLAGFLFTCLLHTSCDDCGNLGCSSISEGKLTVRVTINAENPVVDVVIYSGVYEKKDTLMYKPLDEKKGVFTLREGYYSATATYRDGAKTVIALDGGDISISTDECDCDQADNLTLNLKLQE